jgi:hypothetical protein
MPDDANRDFGGQFHAVGADRYSLPPSAFRGDTGGSTLVNTVTQGTTPVINDTLLSPDGIPLKLANTTVTFLIQESLSAGSILSELCGIVNADKGKVQYSLSTSDIPGPGIYLAGYNVINADDLLLHQVPRYLQVIPDIRGGIGATRPLTIAEVRLAIRDYPVSNTLLDDVEFSDEEILWALTRPIDIWNSVPPDISTFDYNNFPYRAAHLDGTVGELLSIATHHYMRNQLSYQSAGMTVDDKNKATNYLNLSENLKNKFITFVERKKYELNVAGGFIFNPGPYDRLW